MERGEIKGKKSSTNSGVYSAFNFDCLMFICNYPESVPSLLMPLFGNVVIEAKSSG